MKTKLVKIAVIVIVLISPNLLSHSILAQPPEPPEFTQFRLGLAEGFRDGWDDGEAYFKKHPGKYKPPTIEVPDEETSWAYKALGYISGWHAAYGWTLMPPPIPADFNPEFEETWLIEDHYPIAGDQYLDEQMEEMEEETV
jgi:hypothetical protein